MRTGGMFMELFIIIQGILFSILNMVCSVYLYKLSGLLIEYRKKWRFIPLLWYMFLFLLPIYATDVTNVTGALLIFLFVVIFCTKGSLINKLSVVLIFYPLTLGINYMICNNPVHKYITDYQIRAYDSNAAITLLEYLSWFAAGAFLNIIKIIVWFLLYGSFKKRLTEIRMYITDTVWRIVAVICIASFTAMVTAIISPSLKVAEEYFYSDFLRYTRYTFIIVIGSMFSIAGILYLLQPIIENVKNKEKLQIEGLKEAYYRSLEEQQEHIRRIRHDMNNHFEAVKGCLDHNDITGAKDYLKQFTGSLPSGGFKHFCSDSALNAVLNNRWDKLVKLPADVHFNLELDQILEITSLELCTIFSNILDNAIEAVKKIPDPNNRKVLLQARNKKKFFSLRLANSRNNQIAIDDGRLLSGKKEPGHGYGLEIIRDIVDRYGGNMEVSFPEDEFVVFIYIHLE